MPAPIDLQVQTATRITGYKIAQQLEKKVAAIPGAADVQIHQVVDYPEIRVNVDRSKASQLGLTEQKCQQQPADLAQLQRTGRAQRMAELRQWRELPGRGADAAVSRRFLRCTAADADHAFELRIRDRRFIAGRDKRDEFGLDSGFERKRAVGWDWARNLRLVQHRLRSEPAGSGLRQSGSGPISTQLLYNLANLQRGTATEIVNHYDVQPVFDIYANADRRDLGGLRSDIEKIIGDSRATLPSNTSCAAGPGPDDAGVFRQAGNRHCFRDCIGLSLDGCEFPKLGGPAYYSLSLPGALAGVLWMLFITQTTLNVPSLMGAIMSIGVASSNSILISRVRQR